MERYLLFGGDYYYPSGGALDLVNSFDTMEAARAAFPDDAQWVNVLDVTTGAIYQWQRADEPLGKPGWYTPEEHRELWRTFNEKQKQS